jgi:hypothetical protein
MSEMTTTRDARFSPCRTYRYRLGITWKATDPRLCFLMLNPSTADEIANDPTVERCERRARAQGFGGVDILNLFALRSTDPRALYTHPDPIGPDNDAAILAVALRADVVVCAWGNHGLFRDRGLAVRAMLARAGIVAHALRITNAGQPAHPLYIPYSTVPQRWSLAA